MRVQGTTWKEQMPLPNIHLNNGKYPQNSKGLTFFRTIYIRDICEHVFLDGTIQ